MCGGSLQPAKRHGGDVPRCCDVLLCGRVEAGFRVGESRHQRSDVVLMGPYYCNKTGVGLEDDMAVGRPTSSSD